jgi:nicotinate-nucleotide adenylyltransferase
MNKAGILGGTFDPIHNGHLAIAENARSTIGLDKVLFIPALVPPHKQDKTISAPEHRLKMIELAIKDNPFFELSDIEIKRGEVSYTLDTIKQLSQESPETQYYFIIGMDTLPELQTWHKPEELVRMCEFVVLARPGYDTESITGSDLGFSPESVKKLQKHIIATGPVDMSATQIRAIANAGGSIKSLVPEEVNDYILKHELYKK